MSLPLTASVPQSAGFGGVVDSIGGVSVLAGGYYSSIGGGAAPFGPALNMRALENGALLKSCQRHIQRANKKETSQTTGQFGHNFQQEGSTRSGKLYCRSGYHLQIHHDGKVNGTRQENNKFGVLEFLSVAFGLVSIKGKESNRYLCMNRRGRLYGSTRHTGECIFMEKMLENYYNTYTSCRYGRGRRSKKKWYVALNKRGRPKRGNQSRKKHRFTQFLVLHLDDEDYKWTRRKFVFSNRDTYFGMTSFAREWRKKQAPRDRVSSSSSLSPSIANLPAANRTQHQHRLRQYNITIPS